MNFNFSKQIDFFRYEWNELGFLRKLYFNRAITDSFIYRPSIRKIDDSNDIFFFKTMLRSDYDRFMLLITKDLNSSVATLDYKRSINFSLVKYRKLVKQIWVESKGLSIGCRIYVLFSILRYLAIIDEIYGVNPKLVVVHAEMQPPENLLVQVFKRKKIKTVTLQHGLYVDYSTNKNINVVNYENVVSDYFISWGQGTKELVERYNSTEVIVGGAPHLSDLKRTTDFTSDYFTVIFDQNMFHNQNVKLLDIAYSISEELGLNLHVKLHPRNLVSSYSLDHEKVIITEEVFGSRFVLAHTTSLAIELMYADIPVYIFSSSAPALPYPDAIMFASKEGFFKAYSKNNVNFGSIAHHYIGSCGEKSVMEYKAIFNRLICKN